jgi:hypothetical protein
MLFYILNGTHNFEGPKQKTFQEQLIKPVLRNAPFVTIIQNGLQNTVVTNTIQKPNVLVIQRICFVRMSEKTAIIPLYSIN